MQVIYDEETDTLSIVLRDAKIAESDEPQPGLILDYDMSRRLVSVELLDTSDQCGLARAAGKWSQEPKNFTHGDLAFSTKLHENPSWLANHFRVLSFS
jgi:uncharacterized protein YuzE